MGITKKHFLSLNFTMCIIFLLLLIISYFSLPIYYVQAKKQSLNKEYMQIVNSIQGTDVDTIVSTIANYEKKYNRIFFTLYDENEIIVYPNQSVIDSFKNSIEFLSKNDIGMWTNTIQTNDGKILIVTGQYYVKNITDISQSIFNIYPFVILLFVVISIVVTFIYSYLATKRIKTLSRQTKNMRSLKKGLFIKNNGKDEISTLAQDINSLYDTLISNIEKLEREKNYVLIREQQKNDFLRMASHELKTPITSMLGIVEGMIHNIGDFKNKDKYLKFCYDILNEQAHLIQSILETSRLDTLDNYEQEHISLKELLEEMIPMYQLIAINKNYQFYWEFEKINLVANKFYLKIAIKNLLDNAFRYTKTGGHIMVKLTHNQLIISNQPEHLLSEEQLKQIFQAFYRPDFSRNRQDGGSGLGLYIVDQILTKYNLPHYFKKINQSMVFTIHFPIFNLPK